MVSAQLKNIFTGIGEVDPSTSPSSLTLKVAVTDTAFRYFVLNKTHGQVIFYGSYALHHIANTEELCQRIEKIYEKDDVLQLKFAETLIGFDSKYQLLPVEFSYLNAPNKLSQRCQEAGIDIVFNKDEELLRTLSGLFTRPVFLHLNSTFLHLLPSYYNDDTERLFVNVSSQYFDIIHFSADKKLKILNRYEFKNENDFIYFVLLYCDEMNLNRDTIELVLMGELDKKSLVYDICYKYFKQIAFIDKPVNIDFSKAFAKFNRHLHFNLYNLAE